MSTVIEGRAPLANPTSARGQERVSRILEAATELFLRDGYSKTSVDAIVERSGGSKATLYSYFPTKDDLFRAVVDTIVDTSMPEMRLDTTENIRAALRRFGETRIKIVLSERHFRLLRLVIAERDRFPDLAKTYYDRGPKVGHDALATYIRALRAANKLDVDDPDEAAGVFIGMLFHDWYKEQLLLHRDVPSDEKIEQRADSVTEHFLTLYQCQPARVSPIRS